jgi:3-methyladenine DNA glycosylase AlkD
MIDKGWARTTIKQHVARLVRRFRRSAHADFQPRCRYNVAMKLQEALKQLEKLGNEATRKSNAKNGAGDNQFGVKHGDIRTLAKKIKTDHQLGLELWKTGNVDAQLLAILIVKPKELSAEKVDQMVRSISMPWVADWFASYILKEHPEKEALRQKWMQDDDKWASRTGWALTASRVTKNSDGLDLPALLDRIEKEAGDAPSEVQWTMNACLYNVGIHHAEQRQRAIAIGEKLGLYRDYPVSKGCVSPYAPIAINEMVRRQGG